MGVQGAQLVLQHRKLSALLNCHILSLLSFCRATAHAQPQHAGGGGAAAAQAPQGICRVHPAQMQTSCGTGRIGTRNPNMQCFPHAISLSASSELLAAGGGEGAEAGGEGKGEGGAEESVQVRPKRASALPNLLLYST